MNHQRSPIRILVVDDDAVSRSLLLDHLSSVEAELLAVGSAAEAMPLINDKSIEIIIADWLMPDISGLDLLRWVRSQTLERSPHFVMLTVNVGQDRLVEAFEAGADDFLSKPFNVAELRARLRAWTRLVNLQNESTRLTNELTALNKTLSALATVDDLTGLANRREALRCIAENIRVAERHGHSFVCALLDVDHFKQFNDNYGHAAGDEVLKLTAQLLQSTARSTDTCCRVGGDEFLVVLSHTTAQDAAAWAERFSAEMAVRPLQYKNQTAAVTTSIGMVTCNGFTTADALIESADEALYQAKRAGRNTVRVSVG